MTDLKLLVCPRGNTVSYLTRLYGQQEANTSMRSVHFVTFEVFTAS